MFKAMKGIILLLVMLPFIAFGQDTLQFMKVNNGQVYYERIFDIPGKSGEELKSDLVKFIPSIASISDFNVNKNSITARLQNDKIPLKKYGLTSMGSSILITSAFDANINIQVKDGKYKVTVSGVYFKTGLTLKMSVVNGDMNGQLEDIAYKKRKDRLVNSRNPQKFEEAKAFQDYMSGKFQINVEKSDW